MYAQYYWIGFFTHFSNRFQEGSVAAEGYDQIHISHLFGTGHVILATPEAICDSCVVFNHFHMLLEVSDDFFDISFASIKVAAADEADFLDAFFVIFVILSHEGVGYLWLVYIFTMKNTTRLTGSRGCLMISSFVFLT